MKSTKLLMIAALVGSVMLLSSCTEDGKIDPRLASIFDSLGLNNSFGYEEKSIAKDTNEIEQDLNLDQNSNTTLPSSVDLTAKFPPVKNQGQYGTCVAWAAGYYYRTFLHAQDNNLSLSALSQEQNQFSPKHLYLSIPASDRGTNCNGSSFDPAFETMQKGGIATWDQSPYTNLSNCSQGTSSYNAADFKIKSYREIKKDLLTFKRYLAQNRPIVIGAKLGENFMSWSTNNVITDDTEEYQGQHAYHAITVVGYDDNKGGGAFKIINSWGDDWGSAGFIWVGYDYFFRKFCFAGYVASSFSKKVTVDNNGNISAGEQSSGMDLAATKLTDIDSNTVIRNITYDVLNKGTQAIPASKDWSVVYMWYDAFDANKYGFFLYDYYSDDIGDVGANGQWTTSTIPNVGANPIALGTSDNWWNNVNIPAGISIAKAVQDVEIFKWGYNIPTTLPDGKYYFVLWADPFNKIQEVDEDNNFLFYAADAEGSPLTIFNGVVLDGDLVRNGGKNVRTSDALLQDNPNTYTPDEIKLLLARSARNGRLEQKLKEFCRVRKK